MGNEITLPLKLSQVKVIKTEEAANGDFLIYVETTEDGTPAGVVITKPQSTMANSNSRLRESQ